MFVKFVHSGLRYDILLLYINKYTEKDKRERERERERREVKVKKRCEGRGRGEEGKG